MWVSFDNCVPSVKVVCLSTMLSLIECSSLVLTSLRKYLIGRCYAHGNNLRRGLVMVFDLLDLSIESPLGRRGAGVRNTSRGVAPACLKT